MFSLLKSPLLALFVGQALAGVLSERAACSTVSNVKHTFFGYPDNYPPGAGTAYNCGGRNYVAGGTGTYADPLSMASAEGEFSPCEIAYVPYLQKYVRYEDVCDTCTSDFSSGVNHIDIWTGSSTQTGGQDQINCENSLTPPESHTIIRNPASNLQADVTALYDVYSGQCGTSHVYNTFKVSDYCS
ncbi:hypothetical protein H2200_009767 [Cladophialophora chaetospira]|uniref:Uncharacterized protein n=1 Tax=Cladophialophora chaetospira TaxID=386627 RepID=A0AA39CF14_9EURO|nr:hypothetical protein H2200_009767 [Cladophialophora chaetospira]